MGPWIQRILATSLLLAIPIATRAAVQWQPISYPSLISGSDLIVIGKIVLINPNGHNGGTTSCSNLQVSQILLGSLPGNPIRLDFPTPDSDPVGNFPIPHSSNDVFFSLNMEGIWFLRRDEFTGCYRVDHPARFQPLPLLSRVQQELAR